MIKIQNLTKSFRIYHDQSHSLKDTLLSPNRRRYERRIVLHDLSLHIKKGEAVGLIGKNGCGKSTLLKLLCRILYPDSGSIVCGGRISSLIELGAGFHPDMTGRENIYTNASIFGLNRKEIDEKLDAIIAFSELGAHLDEPVRTYSSGMYMRLAFSVAIHVNADILLIDEILAVGDAAFQAKCFDRLMEIKAAGTTIVIVSHSLSQLERICDRTIWLEDGSIRMEGAPQEVHPAYLEFMGQQRQTPAVQQEAVHSGKQAVSFTKIELLDASGKPADHFCTGSEMTLQIHYEADEGAEEMLVGLALYRADKVLCYGTNTAREHLPMIKPERSGVIRCKFAPVNLIAGKYWFDVALRKADMFAYDYAAKAVSFTIYNTIDETGIARIEHSYEFGVRSSE